MDNWGSGLQKLWTLHKICFAASHFIVSTNMVFNISHTILKHKNNPHVFLLFLENASLCSESRGASGKDKNRLGASIVSYVHRTFHWLSNTK